MSRVLAIAVVVAAAVLAVPLAQQPDQLPVPTFRTEANYVRVDAFPTRDGAAVADLTAADFEVLEDKVPQKIEQFEHVVIRAANGGEGRPEPNTVGQSRQAIQDPRARVFVLFLDPKHVEQGASRTISRTLVNTLNRLIGPDDYVGVMVPPMRLRDVTFARRTTAIDEDATRGRLRAHRYPRPARASDASHSHSTVAGGFVVMSYATRLTPCTSLTIRDEMRSINSCGKRAQSAVIPSSLVIARTATRLAYVRPSPITPTLLTGVRTAKYCHGCG